MQRKGRVIVLMGMMLSASLLATASPAAANQPPLAFGSELKGVDAMAAAGAKPEYAQYWVGTWYRGHWSGVENTLGDMRAKGVTPVIEWYYWGDRISPSCVEHGCDDLSKEEWYAMSTQLGKSIRASLGTDYPVVVVIETEFNKGGIDSAEYSPTFDQRLVDVMARIEAEAPQTQFVLGFGGWGRDRFHRFPMAIEASDYLGFQAMRGSTRDTWDAYMTAYDGSLSVSKFLHDSFGKPTFLHDMALSSYPAPDWETAQRDAIQEFFDGADALQAAGLHAIVYRHVQEYPEACSCWYFGEAEKHFGLHRADGSAKPAWSVWVNGIKAHRAAHDGHGDPAPTPEPTPPPAAAVPGTLEAEAAPVKTTGGAFADGDASDGQAWNLWSNGELGGSIQPATATDHTFAVRAKGDPAGGVYPTMELWVAGAKAASWTVDSGQWAAYTATVPLNGDAVAYRVKYVNDAVVNGEDRNLLVDKVDVAEGAPAPKEPAGAPVPAVLEAENAPVHTVGAAFEDAGASNGAAWNLWGNGALGGDIVPAAAGDHAFTVRAKGSPADGGWPEMELWINGARAASWTVDSGQWAPYTATVPLPDGASTYRVRFTNDVKVGFEDRNLYVDRVDVDTHQAEPAEKPVPARLEAEKARDRSNGAAYSDADASGGAGWKLTENGRIHDAIRASGGEYTFTVRAKGAPDSNVWPVMQLWVNGAKVGEWTVGHGDHRAYKATVRLPDGASGYSVTFANGWATNPNRALFVDYVDVTQWPKRLEAEAADGASTGWAYHDGAASGGAGWLLDANGVVRFSVDVGDDAGAYEFRVRAKGTPDHHQMPRMQLWVNGAKAGQWKVTDGYRGYVATADLPAGTTTFSVAFANGWASNPARDLYVDFVQVRPAP